MKEVKYKKAYSNTLIEIAYQDLESAVLLNKSNPTRKENIFFLSQQAIEKALKAVICFNEFAVPMTHDLNFLIDRIPEKELLPHTDEVIELTEFATIRRYEGSVVEYSQQDIDNSLKLTEQLLDWCNKQIQSN